MSVVLYKVTDNSNARLTACSDRRQRKHQMSASLTNNIYDISWWRHQMETFSALLAICAGNSPVTGDFPAQRPETRNVDVFTDVHFNELLSKQIEEQASKPVGWMVYFLLITFVPTQKLCVNIYMHNYIWELLWDDFVFFGLPIVSCSMINNLILGCLWPLVFFKQLIWCSAISHLPGCFCSGPSFRISDSTWCHRTLYVTSSYSTWMFCRGVSGFATDCPCGVWCRGLTTCLLHVGPPFGNRLLNNSWAVGLT